MPRVKSSKGDKGVYKTFDNPEVVAAKKKFQFARRAKIKRFFKPDENAASGVGWEIANGDCCERIKEIRDACVGHIIFSPPFSSLYTFSASEKDMGNCTGDKQFDQHFRYLVPELLRILMPGRIC